MPVGRRITAVPALAAVLAIAALLGTVACSSDATLDSGGFDKTLTRTATVACEGSSTAVLQVGALTCSLDRTTGAVSGCP